MRARSYYRQNETVYIPTGKAVLAVELVMLGMALFAILYAQ